jgi:hypothetical protein
MNPERLKITCALVFFLSIHLSAQTCGGPAGAMGKGQLTMGLSDTYQTLWHGNQQAVSNRIFLKTQYGLAPWLDVYGLLGNIQSTMKNNRTDLNNYKDKSRFTYGVGFNVMLNPASPKPKRTTRRPARPASRNDIGFWGGATVIRYPAEGVYDQSINVLGYSFVREYALKYDCREVTGHAGIFIPYRFLKFYAAGVGWAIQRLDTKKEYLVGVSEEPIKVGEVKATYQSGLWTGGLIGVQIDLPQQYAITIEALGFNKANYQIMVGISQTGMQTW